MLEIRNVTKIYKTKGGVETRALDDVSITFGETGMVFLLGKSGSGKSTLLNVSGGLDEPTSGEVIVKGKSSKDFSGSDFDSYRNTFVGFIFQEYNVLNEFNVEDNIALALDLQGKKKDKEKIAQLLEEVDMAQYAKRKPNTLSGGQKQRIAIARALVKDPQIIMADEPTGALDSATGKQVFETLKKLSKTRLVIVVSHDREFAEIYGDRIVELADGKIISDVTKTYCQPEQLDDNVQIIADNTLSIKSGVRLSEKNVKDIQKFISSAEGDVIITKGEREKKAFRAATRITDEGATEKFETTDAASIATREYAKEESGFIKSRLPAAKAIKIGASGLKLKPVRLVFTILLSFIAFAMFGLFSTVMLYNADRVTAASFADSDTEYIKLNKRYAVNHSYSDGTSYLSNSETGFTPADIETLKDAYGAPVVGYYGYMYSYYGSGTPSTYQNVHAANTTETSVYYAPYTDKFVEGSAVNGLWNVTVGKLPVDKDDICISSYLADSIMKLGLYRIESKSDPYNITFKKDATPINDPSQLVGEELAYARGSYETPKIFKICGIFDSGNVSNKYDSLKDKSGEALSDEDEELASSLYNYLGENAHTVALVSDAFFKAHKNDSIFETFSSSANHYVFDSSASNIEGKAKFYNGWVDVESSYPQYSDDDLTENTLFQMYSVAVYSADKVSKTVFLNGDKTTLAEGEVLLPVTSMQQLSWYVRSLFIDRVGLPIENPSDEYTLYQKLNDDINQAFDKFRTMGVEDEEKEQAAQEIGEIFKEALNGEDLTFDLYIGNLPFSSQGKCVGFYYDEDLMNSQNGMFVSQAFYDSCDVYKNSFTEETRYEFEKDAAYAGAIVKYDGTQSMMLDILKTVGSDNRNDHDVFFSISNSLYGSISTVNELVGALKLVFLIAGIVLAVFASLLMFNFLSVSISNKKKEIGILRAVGARGTDVFKIFFAESGIIVLICLVLSLIGTVVACGLINKAMVSALGATITIFAFSWFTPVMMIALAAVVAVIATFLPVYLAARKKPVESIRAL